MKSSIMIVIGDSLNVYVAIHKLGLVFDHLQGEAEAASPI